MERWSLLAVATCVVFGYYLYKRKFKTSTRYISFRPASDRNAVPDHPEVFKSGAVEYVIVTRKEDAPEHWITRKEDVLKMS